MTNLSIIIPMYNAEKYIEGCLESIYSQNLPEDRFEVVVVNDGSSDASLQVVKNYSANHQNLIIHSQKNAGQSAARNKGISLANGQYLFFADADDFLFPNSLLPIYKLIDSNDSENQANYGFEDKTKYRTNLLECDLITFGISGGNINIQQYQDLPSDETNILTIHDILTGPEYIARYNYNNGPWYYFISRTYLNSIGLRFVEGKLCEDGMFTLTAIINASKICHIPQNVYYYATRPNSTVTTKNNKKLKLLIEGFKYAIDYFSKIIQEKRDIIPEKCLTRIVCRRESYVFFLFVRLIKIGEVREIKKLIKYFKAQEIYPINNFIGEDYNGMSLKLMCKIINNKTLLFSLASLFKIKNLIR